MGDAGEGGVRGERRRDGGGQRAGAPSACGRDGSVGGGRSAAHGGGCAGGGPLGVAQRSRGGRGARARERRRWSVRYAAGHVGSWSCAHGELPRVCLPHAAAWFGATLQLGCHEPDGGGRRGGSGTRPGRGARRQKLARAGLSVVGLDRRLVGGECPYYGCIPSKMMIRAARRARRGETGRRTWPATPRSARLGTVATRIRDEATDDWDDGSRSSGWRTAGARFVRGHGRLDGRAGSGSATTSTSPRGVVLNTGTEPGVPPIDGLADTPYWTNREVMRLTEVPASLVVIGGGAIGCELAQAFAQVRGAGHRARGRRPDPRPGGARGRGGGGGALRATGSTCAPGSR